ncbi:class I SAM-dependent methyltransferase [Nocardioides bizhenqiangii]|uniref:Class I SAM-dependent methyltransferase n=1 Tax=Nocardioides bizhenqiangii TaxID=3095076 RepID=A0ABZ0ZRI0_9ACTN|nr:MULTISPECIES: class I SAM-dependent methyltransferase [unclassified Nocardioides]MDZ5619454.1 class I SAM-dependent methyltransferase [Nocardioides sp. HM23]WQQ26526.1 class I SAM-dependent methyltransferase [Nocardioides sp. HM61]
MTDRPSSTLVNTTDWGQVKQRHRAMWAAGDYPAVVRDLITPIGEALVAQCGVEAGQSVLDVAAGTGNAAIPAALRGAQVVACDLTPELCTEGRREAKRRGLDIFWHDADAEDLPYDDGDFDVVLSALGVMFAPRHQQAADEMVRVTRPGGTLGVLNWTPEGFIGQMFRAMKPFAPPAPAGALPPPMWGDPSYVEGLLGDRVESISWERRFLPVTHFATADAVLEYFKRCYGPTIVTYRHVEQIPGGTAKLDAALREVMSDHLAEVDGRPTMHWEYLVLTAKRA